MSIEIKSIQVCFMKTFCEIWFKTPNTSQAGAISATNIYYHQYQKVQVIFLANKHSGPLLVSYLLLCDNIFFVEVHLKSFIRKCQSGDYTHCSIGQICSYSFVEVNKQLQLSFCKYMLVWISQRVQSLDQLRFVNFFRLVDL